MIVTASEDQTAVLWELREKQPLYVFADQDASLQQASFSPNGKMIAVADLGGSVRIYPCQICGATNGELVKLGKKLKARELTSEERKLYLELPSDR